MDESEKSNELLKSERSYERSEYEENQRLQDEFNRADLVRKSPLFFLDIVEIVDVVDRMVMED